MARERDDDSGRYTREYDDNEFIEAVKTLGMPSTKEVAEEVGCSYTLAYHRLMELAEQGKLQDNVIGNSFAWTTA